MIPREKEKKILLAQLVREDVWGKKGGKIMIKDVDTEKTAVIQYSKRDTRPTVGKAG